MRLAISAIAWRKDEDAAVRDLLVAHGVTAIEAAPSKIGPKPLELTRDDLLRYRGFWAEKGIEIVAMQALLFGRADLAMFTTDAARDEMHEYLSRIIEIGGTLGAKALVFGSPGNRKRGDLAVAAADEIGAQFFRRAGEVAIRNSTCVCIEPNPPEYGCDWITSVAQARALVDRVGSAGFGLHIDAAAVHMAGETAATIEANRGHIRHFHASEPQLKALTPESTIPHAEYGKTLNRIGGVPVVSIEMRQVEAEGTNLPHLERALEFVARVYGTTR